MTFEQVDKHVNSVDLTKLTAANSAAANANLCAAYKAVKPILTIVEGFPFFPAKWKSVVTSFTTLLDVICP